MSNKRRRTDQEAGPCCDVAAHESENAGDRGRRLACCGAEMGAMMAEFPCASFMKKHPVVSSTILVALGLLFLAVPTGAILGIIAFLRTL